MSPFRILVAASSLCGLDLCHLGPQATSCEHVLTHRKTSTFYKAGVCSKVGRGDEVTSSRARLPALPPVFADNQPSTPIRPARVSLHMPFLSQLYRCIVGSRLRFASDDDDLRLTASLAADDPENPTHHQALPLLVTEDEASAIMAAVAPSTELPDMHKLMYDEDERRRRVFEAKPPCRPLRSTPIGSHVSYQLARHATQHVCCCGACGAWLTRPQDVLSAAERACDVTLDDSAQSLCVAQADVRTGAAYDMETADGWQCAVRGVHCVGCGNFVGVRLLSMEQRNPPLHDAARRAALARAMDYGSDSRGVRVSSPREQWLSMHRPEALTPAAALEEAAVGRVAPPPAWADEAYPVSALMEADASAPRENSDAAASAATLEAASGTEEALEAASDASEDASSDAEEGGGASPAFSAAHAGIHQAAEGRLALKEPPPCVQVGQTYLGLRYLRLLDAHRHRPLAHLVPLLCKACERPISYTDQLLCTRRRWGFGRGVPEPACFVNSLVRSNVEVRGIYEETLAQVGRPLPCRRALALCLSTTHTRMGVWILWTARWTAT